MVADDTRDVVHSAEHGETTCDRGGLVLPGGIAVDEADHGPTPAGSLGHSVGEVDRRCVGTHYEHALLRPGHAP